MSSSDISPVSFVSELKRESDTIIQRSESNPQHHFLPLPPAAYENLGVMTDPTVEYNLIVFEGRFNPPNVSHFDLLESVMKHKDFLNIVAIVVVLADDQESLNRDPKQFIFSREERARLWCEDEDGEEPRSFEVWSLSTNQFKNLADTVINNVKERGFKVNIMPLVSTEGLQHSAENLVTSWNDAPIVICGNAGKTAFFDLPGSFAQLATWSNWLEMNEIVAGDADFMSTLYMCGRPSSTDPGVAVIYYVQVEHDFNQNLSSRGIQADMFRSRSRNELLNAVRYRALNPLRLVEMVLAKSSACVQVAMIVVALMVLRRLRLLGSRTEG